MAAFPYEKLEVYQKAFSFHREVFRYLKTKNSLPGYMKNQLGRAALSIQLNIAEGSGRFAPGDRRHFYITARSSAFECAAIISTLLEEGEIAADTGDAMKENLVLISKGLFGMIRNLEKKTVS